MKLKSPLDRVTLMNVLIIDDEKEICLLLKHQLQKEGIDSQAAHTLQEGMDLFDPESHDVVFLDINLPDGNGLSLIPTFKKQRQNLKVIVSSAHFVKRDLSQAVQKEVDKFLPKPFSKENILELLREI